MFVLLRFLCLRAPYQKTIPHNPRARADRKVAKLRPEVIIGFTVTLMIISIGMVSVSQFPQYSALLGTAFRALPSCAAGHKTYGGGDRLGLVGAKRSSRPRSGYSLRSLRLKSSMLCNSKVSEDRCQHIHNAGCLFVT